MKRVAKPRREKVMPVRLYMDDVEAIHSHIAELAKSPGKPAWSDDVKIMAPGFEFETPAHLADHPSQPLRELEIYSWSPFFRVVFHEFGVLVHFEDTPLPIGISVKIKDILTDRRRQFASIFVTKWYQLLIVVTGIALVTSAVRGERLSVIALPFVVLFIVLSWSGLFLLFFSKGANLIYTSKKKDSPGFFTRNKDRLFLLVMGAVVGAVLSGIVTVIIQAMSK